MELACDPYLYHVSTAPRSISVSGRFSSASPVFPASSPSSPLLESAFVPMAASARTSCWGFDSGCCSGWVSCPCSVWFSVSCGSGCSCSPVSSLSALPPEPEASLLSASPFPAWPGACPVCRTVISCGAASRIGFSGSADRMPMSGSQILSSSAQTSTPQPACCAHGNLSKNFFMSVRPPGKGLPPSKVCFLCSLFVCSKLLLNARISRTVPRRFFGVEPPSLGGYPIFNSERWTACFILRCSA